jgi:hypothetical protein
MPQIFPQWTNKIPFYLLSGIIIALAAIVGFFWYFGSPHYTDVGYQPEQPIPYSHRLHAGDLGLDCRYCHTGVERSPVAGVPPTQTCMNCHTIVKTDSEKLRVLKASWENNEPIKWVRVYKTPDYTYFDHSAHVNTGIGCENCHGRIDQMDVVYQAKSLSMGWCLDCHRDPAPSLRPVSEVTNMTWIAQADQISAANKFITDQNIKPPTDCTGCHR